MEQSSLASNDVANKQIELYQKGYEEWWERKNQKMEKKKKR